MSHDKGTERIEGSTVVYSEIIVMYFYVRKYQRNNIISGKSQFCIRDMKWILLRLIYFWNKYFIGIPIALN